MDPRNRGDKITVTHSITTHLLSEEREREVYSLVAGIVQQEVARIRKRNTNALWIDSSVNFEEAFDASR